MAAVLVAAALVGCSLERSLPTHDQVFHEGAGFDGILRATSGDCVWVEDANVEVEKEAFNVLWPAGYRARGQPIEIVDSRGEVIAREGDAVSFGVGDMEQVVIPGCPVRRVLLATELVDVNGQPVNAPMPIVDRPILH